MGKKVSKRLQKLANRYSADAQLQPYQNKINNNSCPNKSNSNNGVEGDEDSFPVANKFHQLSKNFLAGSSCLEGSSYSRYTRKMNKSIVLETTPLFSVYSVKLKAN